MSRRVVAIVGRPNVGKSALFNRLTGRRIAIIEGEPGVTRDRIVADCQWTDRAFTLIDTGGIETAPTHEFSEAIKEQAELAIAAADVILFVVDARTGAVPDDHYIAHLLRRSGKPIVLAANKADDVHLARETTEFYGLGVDEPHPVSAEHGRGIGDLLDEIVSRLPEETPEEVDDDELKIAFVGRPNVGKSSIVNRLLGEDRIIVSDVPGTTRDAIDTRIETSTQQYTLIDTAGVRRRSRIDHNVERYSVARSFRAIDRADVCMIVLDATELITEQDKRIAGYAHEAGKAIVLVVNKWDLVDKDAKTMKRFEDDIRAGYKFALYAPIVFVSALTGQRIQLLLELASYVAESHALRISTGRLNKVLHEATARRQPPAVKGQTLRVYYMTQTGVKPPSFVLFVNDTKLMHYSYERYIENSLRDAFGFVGTPLVLRFRRRQQI